MNLKSINDKIKAATKNTQPTIAGWVNRLNEPQPIQPKRKLGACIANSDQNKKQKLDENAVEFENFIRENNKKFNTTSKKFATDDKVIKIKSTNVNSIQSFRKMNKINDLFNDNPDIVCLSDTCQITR